MKLFIALCAGLFSPLFAQLRLVPVDPTPESATVLVAVALPHEGEVLSSGPVWIQLRVDGYSLGSSSSFDRADELVDSDLGQSIHVIIDNDPYFPINHPAIDPFDEEGYFYDTSYKFEVPFSLKEGMHVLRAFPARSFGESLKGETTFQAVTFYVGKRKNSLNVSLSKPYLTYNEPSGQIRWVANKPVLIDFYLTHCELSPDGYKVRLSVDKEKIGMLTSWQPYYLYGLKKGSHAIRMELLDKKDRVVPGLFNDVTRTIAVY